MSDAGSEEPQPYEIHYDDAEDEDETHAYLVKDGVATATFPDGATYHGPYVGGKRNGRGVYTWADGSRYEGDYVDNERHGRGEMKYADGSRYVGDFVHGLRSGRGTYYYANGDRFSGTFVDDEKTGAGTYVDGVSHTMLRGEWNKGTLVEGHLEAHDGTKWHGKFEANRPAGRGHFEFPSGVRVDGAFTRAGAFRPAAAAQ